LIDSVFVMEHQNYKDEFEQFLHDEVKQHRMYPSDHIWKKIRTELHGNNSWPALSFISLFIITSLTLSTLLINHPAKFPVQLPLPAQPIRTTEVTTTAINGKEVEENYFTRMASGRVTAATLAQLNPQPVDEPLVTVHNIADAVTAVAPLPEKTVITNTGKAVAFKSLPPNPSFLAMNKEIPQQQNTAVLLIADNNEQQPATGTTGNDAVKPETTVQQLVTASLTNNKEQHTYNPVVFPTHKKNSRVGIQFYLTPSTSYRKLTDEKLKEIIQPASTAVNSPLSQNSSSDVNNVVRHKPAIGLEFGFAVLYNMSNRLKFKTGLQMNIRQYYIETFQSPTDDLATISLINYRGVENINLYSPYNNNSGLKATQLDNKLYQVSIPLGIQWEILNGKHFGVNTEASVQPTFTLNKKVYLLSTDLRHYADGSSLLRKWNINTSVGVNLTYKTAGGVTIQLGPQVRYQHLPTYSNLYPIKEYLLDYGARLGITKQLFK